MHDCPECGMACDCDGEDTWFENYSACNCDCWQDEDDELFERDEECDDYGPIYEEWEWIEAAPWYRRIAYRVETFFYNLREIIKYKLRRCPDCGKLEMIGNHDGCVPF